MDVDIGDHEEKLDFIITVCERGVCVCGVGGYNLHMMAMRSAHIFLKVCIKIKIVCILLL